MPFILWVIRAFRWLGPAAARWTLRNFAAGYLASLAIAATKPEQEQDIYRETLREAGKYPSALRRIFFEVLKGAVEEVVWTAFVNYARRIRETDPSLKGVADDVVSS
jgi:hypothetical protein